MLSVEHGIDQKNINKMVHRYQQENGSILAESIRVPIMGGKKFHYLLKEKGRDIGRDILYDILRNNKMFVKKKKKYAITTTRNIG